jgi:hypothetical protein
VSRRILALLSLALLIACGGDETQDPSDSGGADTSDAGSDTPAECADDLEPADTDTCDCEGDTFDGRVGECERTCLCEFGFWSCEQVCDAPDVLALSFVGEPVVTEQSGNGDALVNPGESWTVSGSVVATNPPTAGAETTVRLRSDTIFVDSDGSVAEIPDLREEAVQFTLPFSVAEEAPPAVVTLTLEAFSGFATTDLPINVEVIAESEATLEWSRIELLDDGGGPAVRIEAGDRVQVSAELRNNGAIPAEGVIASASVSSSALTTDGTELALGIVASGGTTTVEFFVDVAVDLTDLGPTVTLAASSDNTETSTEVVDVPIFAPDTMIVTDHVWLGGPTEWTLAVSVENTGRFEITGIEWSNINYSSPLPTVPADPPQCSSDGECDFGPEFSFRCDVLNATCVEDPFIDSMELRDASGPGSLAPGGNDQVEIPLTTDGSTPAAGRVILRANSDLRSHGPFALELVRP